MRVSQSMSIRCAREVNPICGDCLASFATRCCFVDTVLEFLCIRRLSQQRYAFAVFPNNGSTIRRLASLHAVREVPFPPFTGTIKALRLAAVLLRRAWFPSLGATTRRALGFAPAVSKRNHSRPGVLYIRPPLRPTGSGGDDSISQVPEKPLLYLCPVLRLRCDGSLLTLAVRAAWPP